MSQFCLHGHRGHLAVCDVDWIAAAYHGNALLPLSFSTAVVSKSWAHNALPNRAPPNGFEPRLMDLPCAFANTVLQPLQALVPPMRLLAEEVQARHTALVRGVPAGIYQMSFSCMHAWLQAAAAGAGGRGTTDRPKGGVPG